MGTKEHRVAVVVDRNFGDQLAALSRRLHVWICDSAGNHAAIQAVRSGQASYSLESGVTTFTIDPKHSTQDIFLSIFDTVDLHHGSFSHDPPWSVVEVYGTPLTAAIEALLRRHRIAQIDSTDTGFTAHRRLNDAV